MDVLVEQAIRLFDSSSICQQDPAFDIPSHYVAIWEHTSYQNQVKSTELVSWLAENSLTLVQLIAIPINKSDDKLLIDALSLRRLVIEQLHIDPCVLWFIASKYGGFHRNDNATSTSYVMANQQRGSTAGVLLERPFVMCEMSYEIQDNNTITRELRMVQDLEKVTAFGPDEDNVPLHRHKTEQIMLWLRMIADIHINLSNKLRVANMISAVMEHILTKYESRRNSTSDSEAMRNGDIDAAARLLTSRVKAFENYRGADKTPLEMFALFTHEDAAVSADMAKASQEMAAYSAEIAEQAKRDSSAMRTITIITMAFLPATFFATLFAVPTLDWKGNDVVTGEFWIYWAFTLPTTALVFLLWLFLTNRARILVALLGLINRR
ncbi:hypothetical protein FHL15_011111 [Xylaria flabelliformis]|uniref:Uncharacterized protein n=1 Tax=Xylaria flabelliformis TaxID=2512241 RepID=A0A553HJ73_9PEZI|nr:hypothetical protein FHL15_011111 [Xylaria flabelliformis]